MRKVILLDVDSVLVTPGGYRAAVRAVLNHFSILMGVPPLEIREEQFAEMEKRGISSEWDMVPLLLGALWNDILSQHGAVDLPYNLVSAAIEIGRLANGYTPAELRAPAFELLPGKVPSQSALVQGCFPFIPEGLRQSLLRNAHNVYSSYTARLFQQFSLGSRLFSETYHLPAEIETESLLHLYDVSNLSKDALAVLRQEAVNIAIITARPSAPPREVEVPPLGYAPEAERALELVGLAGAPLIGYGSLAYLAEQRGMNITSLIKPSPFHALAATLAAFTGLEEPALLAAADWLETGKLDGLFSSLPRSFALLVVEDTMNGVRSTLGAGQVLREAGFEVALQPLGLTLGSVVKGEVFEKEGLPHFADWDSLAVAIDRFPNP